MAKKTPEGMREQAVQLRKEGRTYAEIEATLGITRPTTCKILKEAGLTASVAKATKRPPSVVTPTGNPSSSALPVSSRGVEEFMPKDDKKAKAVKVEFQCDECGTEFEGEEGDELPESCPECGA